MQGEIPEPEQKEASSQDRFTSKTDMNPLLSSLQGEKGEMIAHQLGRIQLYTCILLCFI